MTSKCREERNLFKRFTSFYPLPVSPFPVFFTTPVRFASRNVPSGKLGASALFSHSHARRLGDSRGWRYLVSAVKRYGARAWQTLPNETAINLQTGLKTRRSDNFLPISRGSLSLILTYLTSFNAAQHDERSRDYRDQRQSSAFLRGAISRSKPINAI